MPELELDGQTWKPGSGKTGGEVRSKELVKVFFGRDWMRYVETGTYLLWTQWLGWVEVPSTDYYQYEFVGKGLGQLGEYGKAS